MNADGIPNSNNGDNPKVIHNNNCKIKHFLAGPQQEADKKASTELIQQLQRELKYLFAGTGCLMAHCHCRQSQISNHVKNYITKAIQGGPRVATTPGQYNATILCLYSRQNHKKQR